MLTTSQTQLVASVGPDGYLCLHCLSNIVEEHTGVYVDQDDTAALRVWLSMREDYVPLIEHDLESEKPTGYAIVCDVCGEELAPACCAECGEELDEYSASMSGEDEYSQPICDDCYHKQEGHVQCELCDIWCEEKDLSLLSGMLLCEECYSAEMQRLADLA